jgi:Transmembrane secretion effector
MFYSASGSYVREMCAGVRKSQMSTNLNAPAAATAVSSPWSPFRHPAFTVLWTATVVSNVGG